ncbi:MAG: ABC transporter ATP-binding protein [Acidobacteria bacterium]|nr:ABC transporter ATP-binding protein [Acidobacteriota bacterium]
MRLPLNPAARRLLPYVARYRARFAVGSVFLLLATAIQLVSPWVLKLAVDDLTAGVTRGKLGLYAGALVGIAALGGICRFWMRRVIIGASRLIEYDLRGHFFARLQQLDLAYFQRNRTGDLMSRATNDLSAVRMMVGPALMYSASTSIVFVVGVALMLSISAWLTLIVLLPLPLVSIAVRRFGDAIYHRSERIQAQLARLSAIAQEALAGVRVVRAYGREPAEMERFEAANREYVARSRAVIMIQGLFFPSLAFCLGLSALVVLWAGTREVVAGRMTAGDFVAFNAYLTMLAWPMIAFGWVTSMLQRGMAAWQRMLAVSDAEPGVRDPPPHALRLPDGGVLGRVELRDLSFAYNGEPVLQGVSAVVEPGQMLALVGPTGSGKSTLVNLLPRLFDPPPGTVFVDGVDVRDLPLAALRGAIGYVPQEPLLFSATVAENVAFGGAGNGGAGEAVESAVAVACLDADVARFPDGLETTVGERGLTLSGGQQQRVALARALLADPRILILDDALSAVDTRTEEAILARLRDVMRERTSIVVSHRISTVRGADQILVLDRGRVVERGTHDELLAHGGLYADLDRQQRLEAELEEA